MSADSPKLKLALFGLGRLGSIRARNLLLSPRIQLVAACDPKPGADDWAASNLPANVKYFSDFDKCLKQSGATAVLVSTATATHAEIVLKALELDLASHVMVEKPIAVDLETTKQVVDYAATKPHLKFLVPFNRRYDDSCRAARKLQLDGKLGDVHAVYTICLDQQDPTGFFVSFSAQSGGIFVDMGVHDIDIARYYLEPTKGISNPKKQVNRVFAVGQTAVYGDLQRFGDVDNGFGVVEFANGKILTLHDGRTLTNGFEGTTRLYGTKASVIVNGNSRLDRVEIRDAYGVRTETTPDAFALYNNSLTNDLAEFATAVLDDKPLSLEASDALEAAKIAVALQFSLRHKVPVVFDDEGMPVLKA